MGDEQMAREAGDGWWEREGEGTWAGIDASVLTQRDTSAVAEAVTGVIGFHDIIFDATTTAERVRGADERPGTWNVARDD